MSLLVRSTSNRVHGLDVARAVAMVGMMIAHYVEGETGVGFGRTMRDFVDGRAMPLFMVLGGIGISFLVRRSAAPDRDLATRALILFPMGLILQALTTDIAIILQYYALFFVFAIGLRRIPDRMLLAGSVLFMALGAYVQQVWAPVLPSYSGWSGMSTLAEPGLWWSLVITGYYPFLPAGAFLTLGMWIGRQDLRNRRAAMRLCIVGLFLAISGSWVGAWIGDHVGADGIVIEDDQPTLSADLMERYALHEGISVEAAVDRVEATAAAANPANLERLVGRIERETPGFRWQRLFDAQGHSQMPAWVIGSIGTSLAVMGISLLVANRLRLFALSVLGEMALTFYAYQAIVINWTPERPSTTVGEEYLIAAGLTVAFLAAAIAWRETLGRGPLERLLRIGAAPRLSDRAVA